MTFDISITFCSGCLPLRGFSPAISGAFTCKPLRGSQPRGPPTQPAVFQRARVCAKAAPSFGRGARFPRRLVGLYELERVGVDPKRLVSANSREELGFSVLVGVAVVATLGVPAVSPYVNAEAPVALALGAGLAAWAVDTLALGGVLARALSAGLQNRRRVATHEAGHFLVSHLLGVAVTGYDLLSPRAVLAAAAADAAPGVRVDAAQLDAYTASAVGLAGISAEVVHYGSSEGGVDDMAEVSRLAKIAAPGRMSEEDLKRVCRWGLMQGVTLLQAHKDALLALTDAMMDGRSVEECIALIDSQVTDSKLKPPAENDMSVA